MIKRTAIQWMIECPHHVHTEDVDLDAVDWVVDNLHPNDWFLECQRPRKDPVTNEFIAKDIFAFRNKSDAMMFKLMWWKPF